MEKATSEEKQTSLYQDLPGITFVALYAVLKSWPEITFYKDQLDAILNIIIDGPGYRTKFVFNHAID